MDQNELLARMRQLVEMVSDPLVDLNDLAGAMATTFRELDEWLSGAGMLPNAWLVLPVTESTRQADLRRRLAAENDALKGDIEYLRATLAALGHPQ